MMMIWCWLNPICISVCELYAPIAFTCSCFFFFLATTPKKIKTNCGPLKKKPETSNDFVEAERTKKEYGTWRGKGSTDDRFDLKKKRTRAAPHADFFYSSILKGDRFSDWIDYCLLKKNRFLLLLLKNWTIDSFLFLVQILTNSGSPRKGPRTPRADYRR